MVLDIVTKNARKKSVSQEDHKNTDQYEDQNSEFSEHFSCSLDDNNQNNYRREKVI